MNPTENPDDTNIIKPGENPDSKAAQALVTFKETFGLSPRATITVIGFATVVILAAIFWFIFSAPPRTLIFTGGPPGSSFEQIAEKYRDNLGSNGVTVKILPSQGSIENLHRLANPSFKVDLGFVQAGESDGGKVGELFTLGSIAYQPLLIFYRSATPVVTLSDFAGKRLAVGPKGSGTRKLALTLLETNGIASTNATLLDLDTEESARALLDGNVDAVFLMGDSASGKTMHSLVSSAGVQLYDFVQADGYTRRYSYLNKLTLPRGTIDLGKDLPPHDINLIGPTVELVVRKKLHPALSDLLLDAARDIHGKPGLLQRRKEFPAALEEDFKISPEATRYYASGKSFFYRWMPFWLASLLNRVLTAFVPMLLILIPGLRFIPTAYKWRAQLSIYRWYRNLLKVERETFDNISARKHEELTRRLDHIEKSVNQMKVPASFAGQFYSLRGHIDVVRARLNTVPVT